MGVDMAPQGRDIPVPHTPQEMYEFAKYQHQVYDQEARERRDAVKEHEHRLEQLTTLLEAAAGVMGKISETMPVQAERKLPHGVDTMPVERNW